MAFRRQAQKHTPQPAWADWIDLHRPQLRDIGLPSEVYLSDEHWLDFLENGHLHRHPQDSTGFEFTTLNRDQLQRLDTFLKDHPAFQPPICALRSYVRHRLADRDPGTAHQ